MGGAKNGYDHLGHGTLKLAVLKNELISWAYFLDADIDVVFG